MKRLVPPILAALALAVVGVRASAQPAPAPSATTMTPAEVCLDHQGQHEDAERLKACGDALAAASDGDIVVRTRLLVARGLYYYRHSQNDLALKDFDAATALDPKNDDADYDRGLVMIEIGRLDRAIREFNADLRLDPADADAYSAKGECYRRLEDNLLAMEALDTALRIQPKLALAWWRRGLVKDALGDAAGARSDKQQAKALDPDVDK